MLEVLPEVIGTVKLFTLIAFAEFVNVCQVLTSCQPIGLWDIGKFFSAVSTYIIRCDGAGRMLWLRMTACVRRNCRAWMEGSLKIPFEGCA